MGKLKFEYNIRGYRYAPESFHIYKGLPGQEKAEIPLTSEQRQQLGVLYVTQGVKSAVDYVKTYRAGARAEMPEVYDLRFYAQR